MPDMFNLDHALIVTNLHTCKAPLITKYIVSLMYKL